ncbi:MAG: YceI family protein [Spirosomataceae bacterium]
MKRILIFVFCVSIFGKSLAQTWQPVTADVGFTAKMFGASVEGKFKKFGAVIKFDPSNLAASTIIAYVDASTIDTDNTLRDKHLREKSDFFEVAKYPKITMKSTKIEKSENSYVGYFDLTVKSITKNLKVHFYIHNQR